MTRKSTNRNERYSLNDKLQFVINYDNIKRRAGKLDYLRNINITCSTMTKWRQKFKRMLNESTVDRNRKRLPKTPTAYQHQCIQFSPSMKGTPILPPNSMILKSKKVKKYTKPKLARQYYNNAMKRIENSRKHRKYFEGSKYTNIFLISQKKLM